MNAKNYIIALFGLMLVSMQANAMNTYPEEDTVKIVRKGDTIIMKVFDSLDIVDLKFLDLDSQLVGVQTMLHKMFDMDSNVHMNVQTMVINKNAMGDDKNVKVKTIRKKKAIGGHLEWAYSFLGWGDKIANFDMRNQAYGLQWSSRWDLAVYLDFFKGAKVYPSIGLGYESDIFKFDSPGDFFDRHQDWLLAAGDEKTKMVARYITLPLKVNFNLGKDLYLSLGVVGGLNFRTSSTGIKTIGNGANGNTVEERTGSRYNCFNPMKLDASAELRYDNIMFIYRQSLTEMFKSDKEIVAYPFSFGIGLYID